MNRFGVAASFGTVGFALGWFTRPLVEARSTSLSVQELVSELLGPHDPLLGATPQQTLLHIGLLTLACLALGYLVARLSRH